MSKFLDPKNDVCFKRVFGSEKNKDILIHFLNDMLEFKEHLPIKEVKFLKTIQEPEIAAHKTSIVDVLCTDEKKNQYIVEIQEVKKLIKGDDISERLYEELNRFSWNDTELLTYDQSKKYADSYLATIDYKYNEGLEKGKQQGIEESKIEIAKNMLSLGIDEKIIKKTTGLSLKQIEDFLSKE